MSSSFFQQIHFGVHSELWRLTSWEVSLQVHYRRRGRLMLGAGGRWVACRRAPLWLGIKLGISWVCAPLWTYSKWQLGLCCFLSLLFLLDDGSDHLCVLYVSAMRTVLVCSAHTKINTDEVKFGLLSFWNLGTCFIWLKYIKIWAVNT